MDVLKGFFSTQGTSSRPRLSGFLAAALAITWVAILLMRDGSIFVVTLSGALVGLATGKLAIEAARRRHDMGKRAGPALVLLALAAFAAFALAFYGVAAGPRLLSYVALLLFVAAASALLLGNGKPMPTDEAQPRSRPARAGPMVVLILTALGASLSYAGYRWTETVERQQDRTEAFAAERDRNRDPNDNGINDLEAIYAKEHPQ